MSFDSIPADLVLKMFERLPFKDRIRLRGVNQLFNEVSIRSINKMRSLDINDDMINYVLMSQPFPSLLESCSPILESIKVTNRSCNMSLLNALTEFIFPKLEQLEITVTNNELTKKLISRNRNLRSVILRLEREFEWPEDIVLEKLEKLEIYTSKESNENAHVNLSPTFRPLIGMVPNLERLKIHGEANSAYFILSVQELNQLLAASPCLEKLHLDLYHDSTTDPYVNMCRDFKAAMPTWHLPKLTYLVICFKFPIPPSILKHFTTSSPQLISFALGPVTEIDDQSFTALSKLKQLRQLGLPGLGMTENKFSKMISLLPSITVIDIKKIDHEALLAMQRLQHLRAFSVYDMEMTKAETIDVITNVPTLAVLGIKAISDARSPHAFIHFLTSTSALFNRNVEIRVHFMRVNGNESEFDQMKADLEEIQKNGGPVVEMNGRDISVIRYRSLA